MRAHYRVSLMRPIPPTKQLTRVLLLTCFIMSTGLLSSAACPTSPHEWKLWRTRVSTDLVRAMREIYRSGNLATNAESVVDEWNKCDSEISRTTLTVQACLRNL